MYPYQHSGNGVKFICKILTCRSNWKQSGGFNWDRDRRWTVFNDMRSSASIKLQQTTAHTRARIQSHKMTTTFPFQYQTVCVRPCPSAVNMILPAFAAECCAAIATEHWHLLSIDISCRRVLSSKAATHHCCWCGDQQDRRMDRRSTVT